MAGDDGGLDNGRFLRLSDTEYVVYLECDGAGTYRPQGMMLWEPEIPFSVPAPVATVVCNAFRVATHRIELAQMRIQELEAHIAELEGGAQ